jgi:hypothetical protein
MTRVVRDRDRISIACGGLDGPDSIVHVYIFRQAPVA